MSERASVAINARAAAREEIGGVERVARELVHRLPELRPERYRVIRPPRALAHRAGHVWEQMILPAAARGARLVLSPANIAPLASGRNVVAIHDAAALTHPEWYGRAYVAWQRRLLPAIALRAVRIITPSEFSRAEIAETTGASPDRIAVVGLGVDERFHAGAPRPEGLSLDRPYVLAVGTRIARKNLGSLEAAARELRERGIDLVAAGSGRAYMRAGPEQGVRRLGYVSDDALPGLYAGALALAFPSLHEGFGLPAIEAMACGTPVVAAARGALPETCGDAALLTAPEEVGDALVALVGDEQARERLRRAGLDRVRGLTWDATAAAVDRVIDSALDAGDD